MMIADKKLQSKKIADLFHRLAISENAGIDIKTSWKREVENSTGRISERYQAVHQAISKGSTLCESLETSGNLLPPLVHEMVLVGEQSGCLGLVYQRLSKHYEHRHAMRKMFLAQISWPVLQLIVAVGIIGLLILVLGFVGNGKIDILGYGLVGFSGLVKYLTFIFTIVLLIAALFESFRRDFLWTRALNRKMIRIPVVGPALKKIALSKLSWALFLTMNVEMDLRRLIPIVLNASGLHYFSQHRKQMVASLMNGATIHETFLRTEAFPPEFLDALLVGEQSGQIVETMDRLSKMYEEEADSSVKILTMIAGYLVWAMIATLIIFGIFRIFSFYVGVLNDAVNMTL